MDPTFAVVEFTPPFSYHVLGTFTDPEVAERAQRVMGLRHPLRRFMLVTRNPDDGETEPITPGPPELTSLVPASMKLGSPSFTLRVRGTGFTPSSVIFWNNSPEPTTFVSSTEVTTGVNMETAQVAMDIPVSVDSGEAMARGVQSNVLIFKLTEKTQPTQQPVPVQEQQKQMQEATKEPTRRAK